MGQNQSSTVRAILDNLRYTGYAFFGRWTKQETLLDPDDVAAGHVVRFRRSSPDRVVRSRQPAHPEIVSVATFTAAQLLRRSKYAGGLATARKAERGGRAPARPYLLRGLARCGVCDRKMQGATIRKGVYYRCTARTLAPGSSALADHLRTVNIREDVVLAGVNAWIGRLFDRDNIDQTVAALVGSQDESNGAKAAGRNAAKKRLSDAEKRLQRYKDAIAVGVDPAALVEAINEAQAERAAARAELDHAPTPDTLSDAEVFAMIDALGDVGAVLSDAKPTGLSRLYRQLALELRYEPGEQTVYATVSPRVDSVRVRGRSCTLSTRIAVFASM